MRSVHGRALRRLHARIGAAEVARVRRASPALGRPRQGDDRPLRRRMPGEGACPSERLKAAQRLARWRCRSAALRRSTASAAGDVDPRCQRQGSPGTSVRDLPAPEGAGASRLRDRGRPAIGGASPSRGQSPRERFADGIVEAIDVGAAECADAPELHEGDRTESCLDDRSAGWAVFHRDLRDEVV